MPRPTAGGKKPKTQPGLGHKAYTPGTWRLKICYIFAMKTTTRSVLFLALAAALASCSPGKRVKKPLLDDEAKKQAQAESADIPGVDVTEASIRGSEFTSIPTLGVIRFEYDSTSLSDEARLTLKKNAEHLKENPSFEVLVAGHCDERGTTEYNLALGQKRAQEVREYYIRLGVPGKSIATISYGEEQQECAEATEECWTKNRRAETKVRSRVASNGKHRRDAQ